MPALRSLFSGVSVPDRSSIAASLGVALAGAEPAALTRSLTASELTDGELLYLAAILGSGTDVGRESDGGEYRRRRVAGPRDRDVEAWLAERVRAELGPGVQRIARGKTYRTADGVIFHVRTMAPHPRGGGESSCFYGLAEDKWVEGQAFVLAFGTDAVLVAPVGDWLAFKEQTPSSIDPASGMRVFKPTLWKRSTGQIELRVGGKHVDATPWIERWDLFRALAQDDG